MSQSATAIKSQRPAKRVAKRRNKNRAVKVDKSATLASLVRSNKENLANQEQIEKPSKRAPTASPHRKLRSATVTAKNKQDRRPQVPFRLSLSSPALPIPANEERQHMLRQLEAIDESLLLEDLNHNEAVDVVTSPRSGRASAGAPNNDKANESMSERDHILHQLEALNCFDSPAKRERNSLELKLSALSLGEDDFLRPQDDDATFDAERSLVLATRQAPAGDPLETTEISKLNLEEPASPFEARASREESETQTPPVTRKSSLDSKRQVTVQRTVMRHVNLERVVEEIMSQESLADLTLPGLDEPDDPPGDKKAVGPAAFSAAFLDGKAIDLPPLPDVDDEDMDIADTMAGPTNSSCWIIRDFVLAGAYPGCRTDKALEKRMVTALINAGVTTFVNLQCNASHYRMLGLDFWSYKESCNELLAGEEIDVKQPLRFLHFPIVDDGVVDNDIMVPFLQGLLCRISKGEVLYVHDNEGNAATASVVACLLAMLYSLGPEEALLQIDAYWTARSNGGFCPSESAAVRKQAQKVLAAAH